MRCLAIKGFGYSAFVAALLLVLLATGASYGQSISASALDNADPGRSETTVGDLTADAVRSAMRADIAFVASSDLKQRNQPFPAGKILASDLASLLSYPDDPLAVLNLTGSAVRQALERSLSIYPQRNLGFLQVSGLRFTFDASKSPGERITSVMVGAAPIQNDRTYTVAALNSLADGALGYWKVWTKDNKAAPKPQVVTPVKALESYLQANPKIDYGTLNRITAVK